jgi:hypothetical protein
MVLKYRKYEIRESYDSDGTLCDVCLVKHNEDPSNSKETGLAEDYEKDEYSITPKFFYSKKDALSVMGKILEFHPNLVRQL